MTKMITNKEIIIEELEEADRNVDIKEKHGMFIINTENFATTLLSKLNIPEETKVITQWIGEFGSAEEAKKFLDLLKSSIPEEGKVIAEGEITDIRTNTFRQEYYTKIGEMSDREVLIAILGYCRRGQKYQIIIKEIR